MKLQCFYAWKATNPTWINWEYIFMWIYEISVRLLSIDEIVCICVVEILFLILKLIESPRWELINLIGRSWQFYWVQASSTTLRSLLKKDLRDPFHFPFPPSLPNKILIQIQGRQERRQGSWGKENRVRRRASFDMVKQNRNHINGP